jgi:hypothetical protein
MMDPFCARHSGIALRSRITISIPERNLQILRMRKDGIPQGEVARRFNLSPSRIYLIEKRDAADRSLAERRTQLREEIRVSDNLERMWPVEDLVDAAGLMLVTRKRLMDHFVAARKRKISLRELMDMCLDAPVEQLKASSPSVLDDPERPPYIKTDGPGDCLY